MTSQNGVGTRAQWVGAVAASILTTVMLVSGIVGLYAYPKTKGVALEVRLDERLRSLQMSLDRLRESIIGVSPR